ncbi:DNA binding protein [Gordonia phage Catfish]|uniref:Helix-turn-helix DNA binding domain protein n=1 Tax=Gordonia phage Catfish TaxID=2301538 RepID=A0A385D2E5_9CAUD|nr:DNA binding protein [Gordonia phage Catfish]AXQ51867.1 helix-turn-helix DNA-binding domain protein [Gordonia phage Catfish]
MIEYMSVGEVAEYLGLSLNTIKSYDRRGYMPEPDARIGRNFGWSQATIDEWHANRPGRGSRTDLHG